jgi:hypothetical protein
MLLQSLGLCTPSPATTSTRQHRPAHITSEQRSVMLEVLYDKRAGAQAMEKIVLRQCRDAELTEGQP